MESTAENSKTVETPITTMDQSNPAVGSETQVESIPTNDAPIPKVPKPRSDAWLHFSKTESGDRAKCNHCSTLIACRTKTGSTTSAMLNHMKRCRVLVLEVDDEEREGKKLKQSTLHNRMKKGGDKGNVPSFLTFDQDACRKALTRYLIKDELSFRTVEREGFQDFVSVIQPRFVIPSRRTVVRDCLALFEEEKTKLQKFFKNYSHSVSLTTDIWTSRQNLSYMCLTAHFIDDDWQLHKKIINFCQIPNHSGETIGKTIEKCLLSWGIGKVFTVTVDNASANDVGVRYLKDRLKAWGGCVLDGEFLHMRCGAHILNLIVKDGFEELNDSIERIRSAIHYVRSSGLRLQKFKTCMEQQKLSTNSIVSLDVKTRWNSTYMMLDSAVRVKKAFDLLELQDGKYREELTKGLGLPSEDDWSYARGLLPFLKCFNDTTVKISGSHYVTGNFYMKEIFGVGFRISLMNMSGDEATRSIASKMIEKFHKYWGNFRNMNLLIYLAAVIDPRLKMQWVSWTIGKVYEQDEANELTQMIHQALDRMYKYYDSLCIPRNSEGSSGMRDDDELNVHNVEDVDALMASMYRKHKISQGLCVAKSELERYLADECEDEHDPNFDILYWWKTTGSKYRTFSLMARDLLAIPVSTVASESAFSTGGRVLDPFRSSLTPRMVEALVCTQDWIRKGNKPLELEEIFQEIEKIEFDLTNLTMEPTLFTIDE